MRVVSDRDELLCARNEVGPWTSIVQCQLLRGAAAQIICFVSILVDKH
jgi:hypothetical protein